MDKRQKFGHVWSRVQEARTRMVRNGLWGQQEEARSSEVLCLRKGADMTLTLTYWKRWLGL